MVMIEELRGYKLHQIIEYIKREGDWVSFEDLESVGVEGILCEGFGIVEIFSEAELKEIGTELERLAERNQTREVLRMVYASSDAACRV